MSPRKGGTVRYGTVLYFMLQICKLKTEARLDLWHRGELIALATRAAAAKAGLPRQERNKKAQSARRAMALLRHNQFARAAGLADTKGIADATQDTLDAIYRTSSRRLE